MSFSCCVRSPVLVAQSPSTNTWQVAQAQAPPQSPSMPGTLWSMAARISDRPEVASTVWRWPLWAMKVILGMVGRAVCGWGLAWLNLVTGRLLR